MLPLQFKPLEVLPLWGCHFHVSHANAFVQLVQGNIDGNGLGFLWPELVKSDWLLAILNVFLILNFSIKPFLSRHSCPAELRKHLRPHQQRQPVKWGKFNLNAFYFLNFNKIASTSSSSSSGWISVCGFEVIKWPLWIGSCFDILQALQLCCAISIYLW